jgi:hypothetical protein
VFTGRHGNRHWPVALATGLLLVLLVPTAIAAWQVPASGQGMAAASPDFYAPSITRAAVAPVGMTAAAGSIHAGGSFVVYATVVDPGSGVASATADVSALSSGATAVALTPCVSSCTIAGKSYGYSSAPVTANAGLAAGTYPFSVWGSDNTGNVGSPTAYSALVDNTPPVVSASVLVSSTTSGIGWVRQGGSYIVYASASDPGDAVAGVTADVSSLTPGLTALSLPKCTSGCTVGGVTYGFKSAVATAASPLAPGAAAFAVTASDAAALTATGAYSATVENTPPALTSAVVVTSATSSPGFVKSAGTYLVYANASDSGSGMSSVKADVSGLTAGQTALALSACTSSCTIGGVTYGYKSATKTAGTLPSGPAAFTVTATDLASNATTGTYSVTVDNDAPVVTATAVATTTTNIPGWLRKSGAYVVYANASDATSSIATVKANVSTITSGQTALALTACTSGCTVGGVTYAYKSASKTAASTLAAGPVSFTVTATDGAANATTATGAATVDNTAATISAAAIATTATNAPGYLKQGSTYIVYGDASDATGIYSVTAKVSSLTTGQTALPLATCAVACSAGGVSHGFASAPLAANATLSAGSKTYTLTVVDLAGNSVTSPSFSVTVDNTAPTVATTFPTSSYAGGWLAGCGTTAVADVCGTASDATAGVASVQFSLRQSAAPNLYWDPGTSLFSSPTEVLVNASLALPSWSSPVASTIFANGSAYILRAVATDRASNTATTSTTFTFTP